MGSQSIFLAEVTRYDFTGGERAVTSPSFEREEKIEKKKERKRGKEEPKTKTKDTRNIHVTMKRNGASGETIFEKRTDSRCF